jgi:hypothetical protein
MWWEAAQINYPEDGAACAAAFRVGTSRVGSPRLLDLHLVGLAAGDVPDLLGGLDHGQRELLCLSVGQAGAAALKAFAKGCEPALEHRAK